MDDIKNTIGENLQKIRNKKGMSLQQLADITGVSKTMVANIEKGEINPTIITLWKISSGLKMPLSWLINKDQKDVSVVKSEDRQCELEQDNIKLYSIFNFDPTKRIEVFLKVFEENGFLDSRGHSSGVEEYLMVFQGSMEIEVNGEKHLLMSGDSIKFIADGPHKYWNVFKGVTKAYTIFYYPDKTNY